MSSRGYPDYPHQLPGQDEPAPMEFNFPQARKARVKFSLSPADHTKLIICNVHFMKLLQILGDEYVSNVLNMSIENVDKELKIPFNKLIDEADKMITKHIQSETVVKTTEPKETYFNKRISATTRSRHLYESLRADNVHVDHSVLTYANQHSETCSLDVSKLVKLRVDQFGWDDHLLNHIYPHPFESNMTDKKKQWAITKKILER